MTKVPAKVIRLLKSKPYFTWWTSDKSSISLPSVVFTILNYGDFDDVKLLFREVGIDTAQKIFKKQLEERNNYDRKVINYFTQYFKRHA